MPLVNVTMLSGRTEAQKKSMMRAVTAAISETLGAKPESIRVWISEVPRSEFAVGGVTKDETGK